MISDEIRSFVKRSYADEHMDPRGSSSPWRTAWTRRWSSCRATRTACRYTWGDMLRGCDTVLVDVFTTVVELRFNGRWEIDTTFGSITEPRLFVHDSPDSLERIADELDDFKLGRSLEDLRSIAERIRKLAKERGEHE